MSSLFKQGTEFFNWSQKNPVGEIPQSVSKEGAGENRIPFTHLANSVPVYLTLKDILVKSPKKEASVLDLGCGTGRNITFVKDAIRKPLYRFFGIDYSKGCIGYAKKQYGNRGTTFIQHDGKIAPFPNESFDFIVSSHVLEHVPQQDASIYVSEIARILKKGGVAVVGTPNRAYCQDIFCKNPKDDVKYRLILPHLHEYYYQEIMKLFTKNKLFSNVQILQTTNLIARKLMFDASKRIRPGKTLFQKTVFEIYSLVRKNSIIQDILAKIGSEFLISRMHVTYKDLIKNTIVDNKKVDEGDNFILVLKK